MVDKLKAMVVSPLARAVIEAPDLRGAKAALEREVVRQIGDGYDPHLDAAAQTSLPKNAATVAADRADLAERRLHQSLRVLRREGAAESAPIALDALAHDAVRGFIETSGWRRLAALGAQGELGSPEALRLYALLSKPLDLEACREVATLAVAPNENAPAGPANGAAAKAVTAADVDALLEVLTSKDPSFGNLVREKLANGAGMAEVSAMLRQRREPVSPNAVPQVADDRGDRGGLTFSLSLNKWVPLDRSFDYGITLSRLFDYEVTGVVSGRTELAQRLSQLAVDPICGNALVPAEKISAFVDDLADAGRLEDPRLKALLDTPMQMVFSTTDGDKVPVSADWELPLPAAAAFFAALNDEGLRGEVQKAAEAARADQAKRRAACTAPLTALLEKYDGVPVRHKRAHGALINVGLAGQSFADAARDDGCLPRSKTLLNPEVLRTRFADAEDLKVRFLFTDDFECMVVSDETFAEVVKKHHFPPNHELLSYGRPIGGSGYLEIDHGRIVGIEDDTVMLPGKLPDNLPPAREVLRLQGFDLDDEAIDANLRRIDWEGLGELVGKVKAPSAEPLDLKVAREAIMSAPPAQRGVKVFEAVAQLLAHERSKGGPEDAARAKASELTSQLLDGFQLFNVAAADFRQGDLPQTLNEFSKLWVKDSVAECLVRRVAK